MFLPEFPQKNETVAADSRRHFVKGRKIVQPAGEQFPGLVRRRPRWVGSEIEVRLAAARSRSEAAREQGVLDAGSRYPSFRDF
jgi:hypothetical protein